MTQTTWHADDQLLDRYAAGTVDPARAASLEAHLMACAICRAGLATTVDQDRLGSSWAVLDAALDAPRAGLAERALCRLGMRDDRARLLAATPALRLSWLAGIGVALAFAVSAAHGGRGERGLLAFLLVAPLLPVVGVAAAFSRGMDPTAELAASTPLSAFRLLLLRSTAVLGASVVLAGGAALALPDSGLLLAGWLLPAFGLSVASLALATFVAPIAAAGGVALAWATAVLASEALAAGSLSALRRPGPLESPLFGAGGQLVLAILGLMAAVVLVCRREAVEIGRTMPS